MKNKYISSLLMGVATLSIATVVSNSQAEASEQTSTLAPTQPANFESVKVSPEQKAFYQVLHMDGISESQRDQYLKQLHENPSSAQNVYSESIKDASNPERRVAQQNAFYEILKNTNITDKQRDQYISRIKENPDASQNVFVESLHATTEQSRLTEIQNRKLMNAKEALQALQKEDTIQNRRTAQRAVNSLTPDNAPHFQKALDAINGPRDAKIKAEAETKRQIENLEDALKNIESPIKEEAPSAEVQPQAPKMDAKEEKPAVEHKETAPKTEEQKPEIKKEAEQAPKVEEKKEQAPQTPQAPQAQPEAKDTNQNIQKPSAPVVPSTDINASTSTWGDYWNAFKYPFEQGYEYIKGGVKSGYDYITETYKSLTEKYNNAKYYTNLYFKYKNTVDFGVLSILGEKGTLGSYISPLEIKPEDTVLYKGYANTRNFVTSGINTTKVLYTLYQNPEVVKTAITVADTASKVKNAIGSLFSFFK
ncbi:B domain-containing protein [Staphylococcus lutrae]|uniref:Immunoglobulin-binding protein Sbi n=1 Tax=Staphylococcus lutrae TaxID=155085 RepID=A0AAC9RW55_9STAP|nr:B domain-containing protein [Staphylococcus lutrae]ARJ50932.1 IgG-binding protein SBI [Staphylococcus lutrae]PNZ34320.1 IgG-binding protein SBI [Staphylococcus lutrae]